MSGLMTMFAHTHASSWFITLALFALSYAFLKGGKAKPQKITQMILRLFYIIMLVSGVGMLIVYRFPLVLVIKGILAIVLIGIMEMIITRGGKGQSISKYWLPFFIALALVLLIGFGAIRF